MNTKLMHIQLTLCSLVFCLAGCNTLSLDIQSVSDAAAAPLGLVQASFPALLAGGDAAGSLVVIPLAAREPDLGSFTPKAGLNESCFTRNCHPQMQAAVRAPAGGDVAIHSPYAQGNCQACHKLAPDHPAGNTSPGSPASAIEACYTCHSKAGLGISHPVGADIIDPETGGPLTCTSTCHDPHRSQYPHLLRSPDKDGLCLKCHSM